MACHIEISHNEKPKTYKIRKGLGFQALAAKHETPIEFDCRKSDCGICLFRVISGADNLTAKTTAEKDYLKAMAADDNERLACQTNIVGDVRIEIKNHIASQPLGITLNKTAAEKAIDLQKENPDYQGCCLRLYLDGKGCDGFYYGVTFDKENSTDLHFPQNGVDVIVDPDTLLFTDGCLIEWIDDERGRGFLVNNPNQKSFRGKFFKQSSWEKKLLENKSQNPSTS